MKCPKCSYFGLDGGDRCRNCGYEFSLIGEASAPSVTPQGRPRATPLNVAPAPRQEPPRGRTTAPPLGLRNPADAAWTHGGDSSTEGAALDLPLFDAAFVSGAPLPPPQRPLSVRRPGTATPRLRTSHDLPTAGALPLEPESDARAEREGAPESALRVPPPTRPVTLGPAPAADALRRAGAWVVDACLILLVDLVTLYFTLRLCGLEPAEWDLLPVTPLVAFFLMLNGGYVVLLTGSLGQTVGKMALQIEVVADGQPSVGIGRATVRSLVALVSLVPAGLGLVWALVGDRRALHDRLAGTRVVQLTIS